MAKTKQVKFGDSPTRTEMRELFKDYLSFNKGLNGAKLCLGLADAFEQFAETTITEESHPGYFQKEVKKVEALAFEAVKRETLEGRR